MNQLFEAQEQANMLKTTREADQVGLTVEVGSSAGTAWQARHRITICALL